MIKYLGELYNYRMIGSSIIFKTLYTLILFGVVYDGSYINIYLKILNIPEISYFYFVRIKKIKKKFFKKKVNESIANNEYSLDPIDNYFRIRLVCIILETCGQYFDRGSTKKKLDCFLLYFQVKIIKSSRFVF